MSDEKATNQKSNGTNQKALRRVGARVFEIRKARNVNGSLEITKANGQLDSNAEPGASAALSNDPFSTLAAEGKVIEPPFDMLTLAMLGEHSSELGQCIEAMEVNIDGTGHRFVSRLKLEEMQPTQAEEESAPKLPGTPTKKAAKPPAKPEAKPKPVVVAAPPPRPSLAERLMENDDKVDPEVAKHMKAARVEKVRLANFFEYATDESFTMFRRKLRRDLEQTGNAYFEVLRNSKGEICSFSHIPSYQMRLGRLDEDPILVKRKVLKLQEEDGSVEVDTIQEYKRFRRFVQSRAIQTRALAVLESNRMVWFKEFGDPRVYNRDTGEESKQADGSDIPKGKHATEMFHLKIYSSRSPYGLPRYIGNLLSIFGDRAAEEINFITFKNNNIPSMAVLVSNGQLTEGSLDRMSQFVESAIQGSDNYSKLLLLEAETAEEDGEDGGQVKIDIKPLTREQHSDAMFQEYSKNNHDKIRRAFRLPPIFVGRADDYTRATAESSRRIADEQVFAPERSEFDLLINRRILPEMGCIYHKYKSNTPNTTDNSQLVRILAGAEKTGGMTPRIARSMLEEILGIDLPEFPPGFPADIPFSLTMAEAVKNQADATEPGQQVTALKAIEMLTGVDASDLEIDTENDDEATMVSKVLKMNQVAMKLWEAQAKSA